MLEQEDIESLEILGHVYFMQGRAADAAVVFRGLLALAPDNLSALKHLAALALEKKDGAEALQFLDAYIARGGDREPAFLLMRVQALTAAGRGVEAGQAAETYFKAAAGKGVAS